MLSDVGHIARPLVATSTSSQDLRSVGAIKHVEIAGDYSSRLDERMESLSDLMQYQPLSGQKPIFISIDCEALRFPTSTLANGTVIEIGITVFDPESFEPALIDATPEDWLAKFKCADYFILHDRENGRQGKRFRSEAEFCFGSSTMIRNDDAAKVMRRICMNPLELHRAANFDVDIQDVGREIVLVGHAFINEVAYLRKLGYDTKHEVKGAATVDTQLLASESKGQRAGLGRLLHCLGIKATNTHNGGNDAAYTLLALVMMTMRHVHGVESIHELRQKTKSIEPLPLVPTDKTPAPLVYGGTAVAADKLETTSRSKAQALHIAKRMETTSQFARVRPVKETTTHDPMEGQLRLRKTHGIGRADERRQVGLPPPSPCTNCGTGQHWMEDCPVPRKEKSHQPTRQLVRTYPSDKLVKKVWTDGPTQLDETCSH